MFPLNGKSTFENSWRLKPSSKSWAVSGRDYPLNGFRSQIIQIERCVFWTITMPGGSAIADQFAANLNTVDSTMWKRQNPIDSTKSTGQLTLKCPFPTGAEVDLKFRFQLKFYFLSLVDWGCMPTGGAPTSEEQHPSRATLLIRPTDQPATQWIVSAFASPSYNLKMSVCSM